MVLPAMPNLRRDEPHSLDVAIGLRIRERRRAIGMSQQLLGETIGVTFQQVQKYERGANRVSFSRLLDIANALGCSLGQLAEGLDAPSAADMRGLNDLLSAEGALELLEAYSQVRDSGLRRALLLHVRSLAQLTRRPRCAEAVESSF